MSEPKTEPQVRCPACGGLSLTPPSRVSSHKSDAAFVLQYDVDGGSLVSALFKGGDPGSAWIHAKDGRACLDCGHLMTFADPEELGRRGHSRRSSARRSSQRALGARGKQSLGGVGGTRHNRAMRRLANHHDLTVLRDDVHRT